MYLLSESLLTLRARACYIMYTIVHCNVCHNTLQHVCTHTQTHNLSHNYVECNGLYVPTWENKIITNVNIWHQCSPTAKFPYNIDSQPMTLIRYGNVDFSLLLTELFNYQN